MFSFFLAGIIISGNRMPVILYIFIIFSITLFEKEFRKYFLLIFATVFIIFFTAINFNPSVKSNFNTFKTQVINLSLAVTGNKEKLIGNKMPNHFKEFSTFKDTWLINKYIGGGIKTFRFNCHKAYWIKRDSWLKNLTGAPPPFICNTHPHNYYLEILAELGLIGFFILSAIFMIVLYSSIKKKYFMFSSTKYNLMITPFIFIFLAEIFPIKSSGSFFTTSNATFIFFILSVLISLSKDQNFNSK